MSQRLNAVKVIRSLAEEGKSVLVIEKDAFGGSTGQTQIKFEGKSLQCSENVFGTETDILPISSL